MDGTTMSGAGTVAPQPDELERHRVELTGYCYRMLGSAFEADDAVQETLVRAWRSSDRFEGRSSVRTWLYRIATNVCLTSLDGRQRRARPMDLSESGTVASPLGAPLPESAWVEPIPDSRVVADDGDPAVRAVERETVRLAFVAALQYLEPRQRAVLILREVLAWKAAEVAELLDTTVAAVNSTLQRARARIAAHQPAESEPATPADVGPQGFLDAEQRALLDRYVSAFEGYDLDALTALLHEEATLSMPPYPLWLRGRAAICEWMLGPGHGCRGSRLIPVKASGSPAFGQYRPAAGGGFEPWALQVVEVADGRIVALNSFLDTARWFPMFGLPPRLDAAAT